LAGSALAQRPDLRLAIAGPAGNRGTAAADWQSPFQQKTVVLDR
jgi:hypothetical protein